MPTNKFVESAFWNFDAMFVPQQHPAREMQDTFYVKGEYGSISDRQVRYANVVVKQTPLALENRQQITLSESERFTRVVDTVRLVTVLRFRTRRAESSCYEPTRRRSRPTCCIGSPTKKVDSSPANCSVSIGSSGKRAIL
jgi:phenylalanyl-tRNA synthetase alpha subunit